MNKQVTIKHCLWLNEQQQICIVDQTQLPYACIEKTLSTLDEFCYAITEMQVRGAPLIGVTAAFGFACALKNNTESIEDISERLLATRPTAINLHWAVNRILNAINILDTKETNREQEADTALAEAKKIWQEDKVMCSAIGDHGLTIIKDLAEKKSAGTSSKPLNILTHCNAGWLATSEWGTALAPIYKAHQAGINIHVWVDETRPRNQGYLTAWELSQAGVPHTLIADNTGGHLMQHGQVDMCIVGSDRTTANGDVCNKIGTYLKALAAHDNDIPFYVALPTSTIDWSIQDGVKNIPIEQRNENELRIIAGLNNSGEPISIETIPKKSAVENHAFDVSPAKYVSALITEYGIFKTDRKEMEILKSKVSNQ